MNEKIPKPLTAAESNSACKKYTLNNNKVLKTPQYRTYQHSNLQMKMKTKLFAPIISVLAYWTKKNEAQNILS